MDPNAQQPPVSPMALPTPPAPPVAPDAQGDEMPPAPMPGGDPSSQQPVTDQEKQVLLQLIQSIRTKLATVKAQDVAGTQKLDLLRQQLLQQVFEKLQMAGIDLTDRDSVATFIANLRQQVPQLADQFEAAMGALLGNPAHPGAQGGAGPAPDPSQDPSQDPNQIQDPQSQYGNQAQAG